MSIKPQITPVAIAQAKSFVTSGTEAANFQKRLLAWQILKSARGQTVCANRLKRIGLIDPRMWQAFAKVG